MLLLCGPDNSVHIPKCGVHGLSRFSPKRPVCPLLNSYTSHVPSCWTLLILFPALQRLWPLPSIQVHFSFKIQLKRHVFWQIPKILPPGTFFPPVTSVALFSSLLSLSLLFLSLFLNFTFKAGFLSAMIIYLGLKRKRNVCPGHTPEQLNENSRMKAVIMYFKSSPDNFNAYPKLSPSLLQWPQGKLWQEERWIYS